MYITDFWWLKPSFKSRWCKWLLSGRKGDFLLNSLRQITDSISKKGNENNVSITKKFFSIVLLE